MNSIIEQLVERKSELSKFEDSESVDKLNEWYGSLVDRVTVKLNQIINAKISNRIRVYKLQALISEIREYPSAIVACTKGCSNCCHMAVELSQKEADAIGDKISRKPIGLKSGRAMPDINTFGENTPCTFLVDGACSIYDNRPFVCREYVNSDRDNLLCSFENWELAKANDVRFLSIPRPNASFLVEAFSHVVRNAVYGDIREFFPPQANKK